MILIIFTFTSFAQATPSTEPISYTGAVAWSPTNELLVSAPSGLVLYSAGQLQVLTTQPSDNPTFSPDGALLAYVVIADTPEVVVQRTSDNQTLFRFPVNADYVASLAFNSDSSLLAVLLKRPGQESWQTTNETEIWDIANRQRISTLNFNIDNGTMLSWGNSPDQLWMIGYDYSSALTILNALNIHTSQLVSSVIVVAFPSGSIPTLNNHWVVFPTAVEAPEIPGFIIHRLEVGVSDPQPYRTIEFDQNFLLLTITEQGDHMAFGLDRDTGTFVIFDVEHGEIIQTVQASESLRYFNFSPDGSLLAVTTYTQTTDMQNVEIWDMQSFSKLDTVSVSSSIVKPD